MNTTNSSSQNLPSNPTENAGPALLGFGGLALLIFLLSSSAAVFAASLTAGLLTIVVIAISVAMLIPVYRLHGWKSGASVLLILTGLWAALGGVIVFKNHWL